MGFRKETFNACVKCPLLRFGKHSKFERICGFHIAKRGIPSFTWNGLPRLTPGQWGFVNNPHTGNIQTDIGEIENDIEIVRDPRRKIITISCNGAESTLQY